MRLLYKVFEAWLAGESMKKIPVRAITGEAYCHESENLEKVRKAFYLFFPKKAVSEQKADSGFGTEVTILHARLEKKAARDMAGRILEELSELEKKRLISETQIRLSEDGKFCIMLDKQLAYGEKVALTDSEDCIKVSLGLEAFPANYANFVAVVQSLF
jgi:RNA binding exosome subunit